MNYKILVMSIRTDIERLELDGFSETQIANIIHDCVASSVNTQQDWPELFTMFVNQILVAPTQVFEMAAMDNDARAKLVMIVPATKIIEPKTKNGWHKRQRNNKFF